jgi:hypothetical protein
LKPGVTLWNWEWTRLLWPGLLPPLRLAARSTRWSWALVSPRLSNGTWTTTKPERAEPLNQPAPPPGFANDVPKNRPRIDMYTWPALA